MLRRRGIFQFQFSGHSVQRLRIMACPGGQTSRRSFVLRSLAELIRFGVKHPIQGFLDNIFHHRVQVSFYLALVKMVMIFPSRCRFLPVTVLSSILQSSFSRLCMLCCRRLNIPAWRTVCNFRHCCIAALFNRLLSPVHIQALFHGACTSAENIPSTMCAYIIRYRLQDSRLRLAKRDVSVQ